MTPRRLFSVLGGFSSEFAPAYYEDADYCMTLWQRGFQVIYEPLAVVRHYESATSGGNEFAQARMAEQTVRRKEARTSSPAILTGLIFDDRDHPMSPSHTNKKGVRYRYYVSHALLQNRKANADSIARVSAPDV